MSYEKPKWKNMPKDEPVMNVSWEDIYARAYDNGINLTKEQVINAFQKFINNKHNEYLMGAFWDNIDYAIEEVSNA